MNSENKKSGKKLPLLPCRVCGSKASGYHFGVISCEACKVFFRRFLISNAPYICAENEKCEVKPGNRGCSYCRLQKCFAHGMSKEGIQKGRYTVEKKSKTIREGKMLLQKQAEEETKHQGGHNWNDLTEEKEQQLKAQENEKEEQMKGLAAAMKFVYINNPFIKQEMLERLPDMQNSYLELNTTRENVFGVTVPLSSRLHEDIYKTTGLDVDNRWPAMEKCIGCCQQEIIHHLKYFKQLPGIKELCPEDMCVLLKAACVELSIFCSLVAIDPDRMLYTCMVCGCTFGEYEFKMFYLENDHDFLYKVVKKLKELQLNDEELSIITPFILLSALDDYSKLKQPELVGMLKQQTYEVLYYVMRRTRGQQLDVVLNRLKEALAEFKEMSRRHSRFVVRFINAFPDLGLPSIVYEIFGNESGILLQYFSSLKI